MLFTVSLFSQIADSYRRTKKPKDILWNTWVARPLAAVLLVPLARTRVTPNQVTFTSLAFFVAAAALLVGLPGYAGLLIAVAVLELSYVLDCADGQLARLRGTSSPIGAHLDFLMDELKAFLLVAATGAPRPRAAGDYGEGLDAASPAAVPPTSLLAKLVGAVESLGRLLIHYPSYLVFVAAANRLDLFLHVYLAINAAYAGRTILAVLRKLGKTTA